MYGSTPSGGSTHPHGRGRGGCEPVPFANLDLALPEVRRVRISESAGFKRRRADGDEPAVAVVRMAEHAERAEESHAVHFDLVRDVAEDVIHAPRRFDAERHGIGARRRGKRESRHRADVQRARRVGRLMHGDERAPERLPRRCPTDRVHVPHAAADVLECLLTRPVGGADLVRRRVHPEPIRATVLAPRPRARSRADSSRRPNRAGRGCPRRGCSRRSPAPARPAA